MASLLSQTQLDQLRKLFNRTDKTGGGSLSAAQVASLLRIACASSSAGGGAGSTGGNSSNSSISDLSIRDLLTEVDVGSEGSEGRCDFEEFCNLFTRSFEQTSSAAATASESSSGADASSSNSYLTPAELLELKTVFKEMDLDQDQLLSATDLQTVFSRIGDSYELQEVEQMIREVDSTKQGKIKLADFLAAMSPA